MNSQCLSHTRWKYKKKPKKNFLPTKAFAMCHLSCCKKTRQESKKKMKKKNTRKRERMPCITINSRQNCLRWFVKCFTRKQSITKNVEYYNALIPFVFCCCCCFFFFFALLLLLLLLLFENIFLLCTINDDVNENSGMGEKKEEWATDR